MTKEELREHCEKQVKMCKEWAKGNDREPSGMIYEEHKLILDLINELQDKSYELWKESYEEEHRRNIRLEEKIKALEQQPCDDCVSRTQAIEWIENLRQMDKCFGNYEDDYFPLSEVIDRLKNVPSVTPTHGTCKECKHNYKTSRNTFECSNGHRFYMRIPDTFYCADYEKRGNENG